jgi:tyrosyl-tRNA synthetase
LIKKSDGGKFGKTEKGNIWLDPEKTSPYQFYQFWLNASDEDAANWIKIFTFIERQDIEKIIEQHQTDPSQRFLQKSLAEAVTTFVHGREEYEKAVETTQKLFSNQKAPAESLSIEDLEAIEGIVKSSYSLDKLNQGVDVLSFLNETSVFESKGAARKMLQNGGISINRTKLTDIQMIVNASHLLHDKFILVQVGKKNYYLIVSE